MPRSLLVPFELMSSELVRVRTEVDHQLIRDAEMAPAKEAFGEDMFSAR